jgi:hypothetical protein
MQCVFVAFHVHAYLLWLTLAVVAMAQQEAGGAAFWTQFPLSHLQFPSRSSSSDNITVHRYPFTLSVNSESPEICIYDSVHIHWNTTSNFEEALGLNPADCSVAFSLTPDVKDNTPRLVTAASIMQQQQDFIVSRKELESDSGHVSLQCLLDTQHCQLALHEIKVDSNTVDENGEVIRKILISFSDATNTPELYTAQSISDVLELSPPLGGEYGAAVGEWVQSDLLRISVSEHSLLASQRNETKLDI